MLGPQRCTDLGRWNTHWCSWLVLRLRLGTIVSANLAYLARQSCALSM
jgi:hypothetical protein